MAIVHGKPAPPSGPLTVVDLHLALQQLGSYGSLFVPEFTWKDLRIDGILIEPRKRWIRGFEIKLTKADFYGDEKWQLYSEFTSSLAIACPEGLVHPDEVEKPFGLLYVSRHELGGYNLRWAKKPRKFQKRGGLAWTWTYLRVLELEFARVQHDLQDLRWKLRDCQDQRREP